MAKQVQAETELKKVAREIGQKVRKVLDQAAKDTMDDFYKDYSPKYYERTGNLKQAFRSRVNIWEMGPSYIDSVTVTFSAAYMNSYKHNERFVENLVGGYNPDDNSDNAIGAGWTFEEVNPGIVFDLDFMEGYHGGKYWQKTRNWNATRGKKQSAGKYWQKAEKMSPSPYELMEKRYEEITREGGPVDVYVSRDTVRQKVNDAIDADIIAALNAAR